MPKALEQKLGREASKKGLTGDRRNAYIYGTMRKTGWTPGAKEHSPAKFKRREGTA